MYKWLRRYEDSGLDGVTGLALARSSTRDSAAGAVQEFAEKVIDIVGLYLDPSDGAVVLSVDEKTQVQALERTQGLWVGGGRWTAVDA